MNNRRRWVERAVTIAIAAICSVPFAALAPPTAHASTGLERAGTLPITTGTGIVADAATRRLLVIEGGRAPLSITAFDADRLTKTARADFPTAWPQAGTGGRTMVFAFDEKARRLSLLVYDTQQTKDNSAAPSLIVIDVDRLTEVARIPLSTIAPPGIRIVGLLLRPDHRAMLLMQAIPSASAPLLPPAEAPRVAGVTVVEIDLASITITFGPVVARGCQSAITNQTQSQFAVYGNHVFVGCGTAQALALNAPGVSAISEIDMSSPTNQRLAFLPGSYATGDVFYDEPGARLLLVSAAANRPNQAVWVYDLEHRTFVGQVAAGEANLLGTGFNATLGRVYLAIDGALLVTSDRGAEIAQAATFPLDVNIGPIVPIPFSSSVIVPMHGKDSGWVFAVFRDTLPASVFVPGVISDAHALDALTTDTPQFTADAQAFGMRIHTIGGVNSLAQNTFALGGSYWSQAGNLTGLKDGDRDVGFSKVVRAHLSEGDSSAESVGAVPDSNTASDYVTVGARAPLGEWPYKPAGCRDFGAGSAPASTTEADASCDVARGKTTTGATFDGLGMKGMITVASSSSQATIERTAAGVLTTKVHAEAHGIVIGAGSVRIGSVFADAVSTASGKRGGAAASYTRAFENVQAGDFKCGSTCDPAATLAALTDTLGAQVRVELPAFEIAATPGGAHAHAAREPWQHRQDVVLNNQDPTQDQVPALRLTFVNDATLASRLIVELAAAKADATVIRLVPGVAPVIDPEPGPVTIVRGIPPAITRVLPSKLVKPIVHKALRHMVSVPGHGWRVLASGGAGMVARAAGLWALLVAPVFFALRRRPLLRLRGGGS